MSFKTVLVALIFTLFGYVSFAQNTETDTPKPQKKYAKYIDARYEFGAMLGTDSDWSEQIVNSSAYMGLDFRLGFRKTDPNNIYSNVYRRPYFGLGFYSSTFHNADVGYPNAIYFFLTIPIKFEEDKKFTLSYSGAYGVSYNFNAFDSINNPTNVFLGSDKNIYVHLEFDMNYKFNEKWAAYGAVGFKHFSNGSFKQPNFGINLLPVTLGVRYNLSKDKIDHFRKDIPEYIKNNIWNIAFIAGSKNYEVGGDNYLKATVSVNYLRQLTYKHSVGLGLDFFYSDLANLRNDSDASDFSKSFSIAAVASGEWKLTKNLYVPMGIGFYLHRNVENDEKTIYYERVGMRYRFAKHYFAGLTIKAHGGAADIFEWTVGYTFHKDPNKF
jgi:hypothetical protein